MILLNFCRDCVDCVGVLNHYTNLLCIFVYRFTMLTFLYYNHLLLYHGTGSIRGVQQAPRIRMYWRVGALKELVESEAAATARHFNREFTTGFLGPPHGSFRWFLNIHSLTPHLFMTLWPVQTFNINLGVCCFQRILYMLPWIFQSSSFWSICWLDVPALSTQEGTNQREVGLWVGRPLDSW